MVDAPPLHMLPLRFTLQSLGLRFPSFPGSIWHGGLGMVLAAAAPSAFAAIYRNEPTSPLYALAPPAQEHIPPQTSFTVGITLFGPACEHALAVTDAISRLGRKGLRPGGQFELIAAEMVTPQGPVLFADSQLGLATLPESHPFTEYLDSSPQPAKRSLLCFTTPLRIKEGNALVTKTPTFAQLMHRVLGRVEQLAYAAGAALPLTKEIRESILAEARGVETGEAHLSSTGIQRRSARTLQQMHFSGLTGTVEYRGTMALTLPWLKLATLIQVGGKTAFGFGVLDILELE